MVALDLESITQKLKHLQKAIASLKKLRDNESVSTDDLLLGSVKYFLFLGIEAILDIGHHILIENFNATPDDYENIIALLGKNEVMSKNLTEKSAGMGGFRNKLAHEYAEIDDKKVLSYLQFAPEQFEEFNKAFKSFITKKKMK